jgi:hypothetical protein
VGVFAAALLLWGCGGDGGGTGKGGAGGGAGKGGAGGSAGKGGAGGSTSGTGGSSTGGSTGGSMAGSGGRGGTAGGTGGTAGGTGGSGTGGTAGGTGGSGTGGTAGGTGGSGTGGTAGGTGGSGTGGTAGGTGGSGTGGSGTGGTAGGTGGSGTGGAVACTNGASCTLTGAGGSALNGVCANNACGNCAADSTCATAYGTGHICVGTGANANCVTGDCHQNADCNGKICSATTNMCTSCTGDAQCVTAFGANHLCQSGTCVAGNCRNNGDCTAGQICNASSQCVSCNNSDTACTTAYGNGYICVANSCVTGTCHDNTECSNGQACTASHVCGGCGTDDAICGTGRICQNALCVTGNCHTNNNCSNGQVCLSNTCAACTTDNQCATGQLCLSGGCTTGNCRTASDCSGGQVCTANNCAPCATDGACVSGYGADHLCNSGACVSGNCRAAGDCHSGGTICNTGTMLCGACTSDAQCVTEYGAGYLCNGGVCITGNCHTTTNCSNGQVCNLSNHTCEGCNASDTTCADAANYGPNHICQNNACISGNCHVATDCNNSQQICSSNSCGVCATNADCVTAYGANHVCSSGACLSGNCNSSADCAGNSQLCVNHACVACTSDTQCLNDTQYGAMHLCLGSGSNAKCVAGNCHDTSADCTGTGQICGITTAHVCGSCGASDAACKGDSTYGSGDICLAGACVAGDCHDISSECTAGKICGVSTPHTCGNCAAGGAGDTQCVSDTRYGNGNICFQGLCGVGNCHATSADCTSGNAGLICGASATNTCGTCTNDAACTSDPFYGANFICDTTAGANQGKCVTRACSNNNMACAANTSDFCCSSSCTPGNCCVDADCGAIGTACVNHTCSACNAVTGNTFYVDPVNGNDSTGTGSTMSGTTAAPGCAFKTVARAIVVIGASPPSGTKIVLVGSGTTPRGLAATDTLPISVPANTTLTTTGGPITITLLTTAAGNPAGIRLLNNNSAVSADAQYPLILDGNNHNAGLGIQVATGVTTNTFSISNVTVQNTNGVGIRVNGGTVTIGGGVVVSGSNSDGLFVNGGVANITNASGTQTLFTGNAQYGIEVGATGSVNVTGTPGAPVPSNNGTVIANFNTQAGLRVAQTPGGTGALCSINGLVSWGNTNRDMLLQGGSKVKLRNSVLGTGPEGIRIQNNGTSNDISQIDLGTGADPGNNWIQTPNGASGFHANAGICIVMQQNQGALTLNAGGNRFINAGNPGTQLNCATGTGTVTTNTTCTGRVSIGNATTPGAITPTVITNVLTMCN